MLRTFLLLGLPGLVQEAFGKNVYLDWNITWVNAAPNGVERPIIGINGQWPCPQIDVHIGDNLVVDVYNALGNQSTGIHWHGFHQNYNTFMDGVPDITQCPIKPKQRMRYVIPVNQTGTYWYHSHQEGQYPDGIRGPIVVHDTAPLPFHYDEEITVTLSDWYNRQMPQLTEDYVYPADGPAGLEPLPDAVLFNDAVGTKIPVKPNKTYLIHVVCMGNWAGHAFIVEDHDLTVVRADGILVEPKLATPQYLRMTVGQRLDLLLTTKNDTSRNYAIWDGLDIDEMFIRENRAMPEGYNANGTAWLMYNEDAPFLPSPDIQIHNASLEFLDDVTLTPVDGLPLLEPVSRQIVLDFNYAQVDGVPTYTINGNTYETPKEPTLYTALAAGSEESLDPSIYGSINQYVVEYGEIVELVINNNHNNLHPWHLHGHDFQILQRTYPNGGAFNGYGNISAVPSRRDTLMVEPKGHAVLRFKAMNPGIWMFHCHIEFHVETRLMAVIIEAPDHLQNLSMPADHRDICSGKPSLFAPLPPLPGF
ncbi:hypothetical protein BP00DRAFT_429842 [Aspergillus indologenus CBS 114.80]|uniref:Multicopper oxidase n=1 Tax=Aspergillus indologenus CBS 114.80 TaxID=1450541 RepID=A0A2V5HWA6_9EURO|nr:hypothetical protein BP00DRAFT_429842 [Aspergillus indologenus CBS 114.80]